MTTAAITTDSHQTILHKVKERDRNKERKNQPSHRTRGTTRKATATAAVSFLRD